MSALNLILLCISEIYGDFKLKDYARKNQNKDLFSGLFGYGFVLYFLVQSLKKGNVLYVNGMWDGLSAVIESVAAYFLLGERLNTKTQYIGLFIIIIGIIIFRSGGIAH